MKTSATERAGILVLGAGELGAAVLLELSRLRAQGSLAPVTVLLRPARGADRRPSVEAVRRMGYRFVEADLARLAVDELAAVFARYSQVICCTGFVGGAGTQRRITEAVLRAAVDHYIPWQFGVAYDLVGRGSGQDVWDEQLDVRDMLRRQDRVRWTIISTGIFTSFVFLPTFGVVDLSRRKVTALGSWDHRLTATTPEDIGRVTALVTADPDAFADRIVYVAGDTFTYRDLAETVDQVLGIEVERDLSTEGMLRAEVAHRPEDVMGRYRLAFARPDGVAWPVAGTLNAERGMAMVDVATWLRRWRDRDGAPVDDDLWFSDEQAARIARPEVLLASPERESSLIGDITRRYYGSWNTDSESLFGQTVSPEYVDRTPPIGRTPDRSGLAGAQTAFRTAFPDGRVHVLQQIIAGDRVVSHLRVTGRFTGRRLGVQGRGQRIDYRATDIMRVARGQIVENWHVEDDDALHGQIG